MEIIVKKNIDELSKSLADWFVLYVADVLNKQSIFSLCLSGGSTPQKFYQILSTENYRQKIEWAKILFFWGDERAVPFNDEKNNARMAFENFLDLIPVKKEQIHIIPTDMEPADAATAYQQVLQKYFAASRHTFDFVLLGLGDNAHTLSLFPGYDVVHEKKEWVSSFYLKEQNMYRITITAPVINKAAVVAFLVSGADKAMAVQHIIKGKKNASLYPAQVIHPQKGKLYWWLDEAGAKNISIKQ